MAGENPRRALWWFFALTFAISWGVGGLWLLFPKPLTALLGPFAYGSPGYYVAAYAPSLVALALTYSESGPAGLRAMARRLRPGSLSALAIAVLAIPFAALALTLVMPRLGAWPVTPADVLVKTPLVLFATAQVVTNSGPLGEEFGWRGYALPRLLERWSPPVAAVLLGLIWTLWHVPAFLFAGIVGTSFSDLPWYALDTVGLSLLMTWLHLRSRVSILTAGLVPHFVINGLGAAGAWRSRPAEAVALALVGLTLFALSPPQQNKGGTP